MHVFLLAVLVVGGAAFGAVAVDEASACQPYTVICPLNGEEYRGCGSSRPLESPMARCAMDVLPP
ncbi:MAG: hypothetical protein ACPGQL_09065 [Thermoplasmatota archaeon]